VYGYDLRLEVHGERGKLVAEDALDPKLWRFGQNGISAPHVHYFLDRFREAYRLEVQAFVDAVRAGDAPTPGPRDAIASLRLALAAKRSREAGVPVEVEA
jgi:myo-inositol 2-dehydrogenase/D-chiro-inositol 1-dehydrogenase